MERIGIVAGGGELPGIFAKEARKKGAKVIGFALKEMASDNFADACDRVHWLSIGEIKKFAFLLLVERIKKIVLLGKVDKTILFKGMIKDEGVADALKGAKDKSDYSILEKVTSELKKIGVEVIDGIEYVSELIPSKGVVTKTQPSQKEYEDINFGLKLAKESARLDIGQTVVVKDKAIVSIEAMEGTDDTIKRAAKLCGEGFVVVKAARPEQDMRWDVPVIGPETVRLIAENKGRVLAIKEQKMFFVDKETCVKIADENNVAIVVM